jgi:hypothetical protein
MKKYGFLVLLSIAAVLPGTAASGAVLTGNIFKVDADSDGLQDDLTIDRITFSVTAGTTVFFDSLVLEASGIDLNGDGEITGFDNEMDLFSGTTLLAWNDDSGLTFGDGSNHHFDSTITYTFTTAGTYMITIGQLNYSESAALQGFELNRVSGTFPFGSYAGPLNDHADWQLTITATNGTVSNLQVNGTPVGTVPEPATLAMWGMLGLVGVAYRRRKRA